MRTVVIGGTGHIGSWLVPELVQAGHETIVVSRGDRRPYGVALGSDAQGLWDDVRMVRCDRQRAERDGVFGATISELRPDAVVDLTCFTSDQSHQLVDALDRQQLVQTGSIWSYGASEVVPTREDAPRHPFGDYGLGKLAVEQHLLHEQRRVRASVVHPGHISGPGWWPIGPTANLDVTVIESLRRDGSCVLPDRGNDTIHHVHAHDVARLHLACLQQPDAATGQAFASVCSEALTLRGYASVVARHFGHEPRLSYLPWQEWAARTDPEQVALTDDHLSRSPMFSMQKAADVLGFTPLHGVVDTVVQAIDSMLDTMDAAPGVRSSGSLACKGPAPIRGGVRVVT